MYPKYIDHVPVKFYHAQYIEHVSSAYFSWYPRRRPCGVAFNTLVDLNKLARETPS